MARTEEEKAKLHEEKKEQYTQLKGVWSLFVKYWDLIVEEQNLDEWQDLLREYDEIWKENQTDIVYTLGNWTIRTIEAAQKNDKKAFRKPQYVTVKCEKCKYRNGRMCGRNEHGFDVGMNDFCSFGQWRLDT